MSAAIALIRFNKTGNVYYGDYEGTSDILSPFICTPKECYDEKLDCYDPIGFCRKMNSTCSWIFPSNVTDLDDVEIYSDYGGGFYWTGAGSESIKMLKEYLNPWEECSKAIRDGKPEWFKGYVNEFEEGTDSG